MEQIKNFLEKYEEVWWDISATDCPYPCTDIICEILNEEDYYGQDFSENNVFQLFYSGASNYFVGTPVGNGTKNSPVHYYDAFDEQETYFGTFHDYIIALLEYYKGDGEILNEVVHDSNQLM